MLVDRLTLETATSNASALNRTTNYTLDLVGNRLTEVTTAGGSTQSSVFAYDNRDRLTDEWVSASHTIFGYDLDGNQTLVTNPDASTVRYTFDLRGRMTQAQAKASDGTTVQWTETMTYNTDGIQTGSTLNGVGTHYLIDANNPTGYAQVIEELNPSGGLVTSYLFGLTPISQTNVGTGQTSYFLFDGHSGVRQLINASGTVAGSKTYNAYGNIIVTAGAITSFGYRGLRFDVTTHEINMRARWYRPSTGTFDSDDPRRQKTDTGLAQPLQLYCAADPINRVDPSGQISAGECLVTVGIISIGAAIMLPAIRGAYNSSYHVAANGQKESLFAAAFQGDATWEDFRRVLGGFGSGFSAGSYNALDTLTFRQISPIHELSNELWTREGLQDSWVGTASNVMAWVGTASLYSAAAVWAWGAAGGGTMNISISRAGSPWFVHVQYGANGVWQQAVLGQGTSGLGGMTIVNTASGYVAGTQITGIPVLLPQAVIAGNEAGYAFSCVTAAIHAFFRGWGLP